MKRLSVVSLAVCTAAIYPDFSSLKAEQATLQQSISKVSGTVYDTAGEPLIGVNVVVKGTTIGTMTDYDGKFSLDVPANAILEVSYIGYKSQEIVVGKQKAIKVVLSEDSQLVDEVVVVGYGTQKKANLTGAVSTIDVGKSLESRPVTDVAKALQGVTPGLSVSSTTGDIGGKTKIRLRGTTGSLNADQGASPLILVDNVEVPDLNLINPDDIESISVLKDAASSAIYGTRAAWGVILVTTKGGKKKERTTVSYSNNFAWSTPTVTPKMAKPYDNAKAILSAETRKTGVPVVSVVGYNIDELALQKMKEWEDLYGGMNLGMEMVMGRDFEERGGKYYFYRPFDAEALFVKKWTPQQSHNLSINGGTEKTSYNIGLGYLNQSGVLKVNTDSYQRYNLSLNLTTEIRKWWDVNASVLFTNSIKEEPYKFSGGYSDAWYYLYRWPSFYPYGSYDGKYFRSPVQEIAQANRNKYDSNYLRATLGSTFDINNDLNIKVDYTFSLKNDLDKFNGGEVKAYDFFNARNPLQYTTVSSSTHNRSMMDSYKTTQNILKAYGTYDKLFNDIHSFKAMLGMDLEYRRNIYHSSQRRGLIDFNKPEINLATGDQYASSYHNDFSSLGYFGRINYVLADKYLFEVNARLDGSSKFPVNDKWGFFPSASLGWRMSEEKFMDWSKPALTSLKLRGSWGSIGSQDVKPYSFIPWMESKNSNWVVNDKNEISVAKPNLVSSSLTWERVTTLDFGFDARLLDDRLGVTFDWYRRTTSNMHTPGMTLPSTFGENSPLRNYGEMQGQGWEISVDFNHRFANGIGINVKGMVSDVIEKLTKFSNTTNNIYGNYQGKRLGEIWGYTTDRFFTSDDFIDGKLKPGISNQYKLQDGYFIYGPGDIKFVDKDGNGYIDYGKNTVEDHGDLSVIGNDRPRFEYGFSLGADWKGFDFNVFFQGVGKQNLWSSGNIFIPGFIHTEGWFEHQMDYWTPENPNAFYPRPTEMNWSNNSRNFYRQTKYMIDKSYLRCKNLTVGYSLQSNVLRKIFIDKARVYFSAENLFEFDNMTVPVDPETTEEKASNGHLSYGRSYPFMRTLSFGVQISF